MTRRRTGLLAAFVAVVVGAALVCAACAGKSQSSEASSVGLHFTRAWPLVWERSTQADAGKVMPFFAENAVVEMAVEGKRFEGTAAIKGAIEAARSSPATVTVEYFNSGTDWFAFQERRIFGESDRRSFVVCEVKDGVVTHMWWSTEPTTVAPVVLEGTPKKVDYKPGKYTLVASPASKGPWPIVVVLHGSDVIPEYYLPLGEAVARQGAVVFLPQWDMTLPETSAEAKAHITRGLDDVADAVRFARSNASTYGADPGRVVIAGHSAGAMYGMTIALAGDQFGTDAVSKDVSALPDAFVALDGPFPLREALSTERPYGELYEADPATWDRINAESYLGTVPVRRNVPFRYFVAEGDFDHCISMVERMKELGYTASVAGSLKTHADAMSPLDEVVRVIYDLAHPQ